MAVLNPTPADRMVDALGRPYFLWDTDITLEGFKELLRDDDEELRAYMVCKLMRQAKPDDVFTFIGLQDIRELWPKISYRLGRSGDFWAWILGQWGALKDD